MPIVEPYISSYSHIFGQNASKLHFLYPTKLVEYECIKNNVEKSSNIFQRRKNAERILHHFLEENKTFFFGIGAPMPIFEPYISSYSHIFGQNASKMHFLYPTKLVEYEYVKKNVEKSSNIFQRRIRPIFLALKVQCQFLSLKSALTIIFLVKMPQNITFCIQLNQLDINMRGEKNAEQILQHFLEENKTYFFGIGAPMPIFEPLISSYNHTSGQNATKCHFFYPTRIV